MNGSSILIDTNIAIFLLNGDISLADILHHKRIYISFITQLELLGYPKINENEIQLINTMIDSCVIIDVNNNIKTEAIRLRRNYSLKLPDCLIAATAIYLDLPLITADKTFKKIEELKLIFYENAL